MTEDISVQILTQASDNIQKLFDLSTRIDERVKMIQSRQEIMDRRIDEIISIKNTLMQKIAVIESKEDALGIYDEQTINRIENIEKALISVDKRLDSVEGKNEISSDRWNKIATFVIQLVWVILAAYLLTKLHLQAPSVP